ncbi:MAG: heavy-metal-associated domain-containing protein [Planctomycetes bacterium]|nr:heavy-metal-associated domain-containing protein [Planctomycetota bacterium]
MQKTLAAVPGVESATVDFAGKTATVKGKGLDPRALAAAVNAADGGGRFEAVPR